MKKKICYSILLILLLNLFSPFVLTSANAASPGELLSPDVKINGTINDDNENDYYGIEFDKVGSYNVTINSTGGIATLDLYDYQIGFIGMGAILTRSSNSSVIIDIYPGPVGMGSFNPGGYFIDVNRLTSDITNYTIEIKYSEDYDHGIMQTDVWKSFNLTKGSLNYNWLQFNATGMYNAYNISWYQNSTQTIYYSLLTESGSLIYDRSTGSNNSYNYAIFDPGLYYFRLFHYSTNSVRLSMKVSPLNLTVVNPGDSLSLYLNDPDPLTNNYLYQLNLEEGMKYNLRLDMDDTLNAAFRIYKGQTDQGTSLSFSDWSYGLSENVTDLVFFGQYAAYSDWDMNATGNYTRSSVTLSSSWEGEIYNVSKLMLNLYSISGFGSTTFSIDNGTETTLLSTTQNAQDYYNNTQTALWNLYKLPDLSKASGYMVKLNHIPEGIGNFSTNYIMYTSFWDDPFDVYDNRPFYTAKEWDVKNNYLQVGFSKIYNNYEFNSTQEEYFFNTVDDDKWLFVNIQDAIVGGSKNSVPALSGTLNVTLEQVESITVPVGFSTTIIAENEYPIEIDTVLIPNHFYQLTIKSTNFSLTINPISGYIGVYNSSGLPMSPYSTLNFFISPHAAEPNTFYKYFQAKSIDQSFKIVIPHIGDGQFEVLITDITYSGFVLEGVVIIGISLGTMAILGLIVGILVTRRAYKK
ncbi:MAG: hypothetical protein ACTSUV_02025 [Candidatus Ranarchaeia archaeon]